MNDLIWLIPAFPLAGFLFLVVFGRRLGEPLAGAERALQDQVADLGVRNAGRLAADAEHGSDARVGDAFHEHAGADHLKALARISRLLREPQTIERLRAFAPAGLIRMYRPVASFT